MRPNKLREIWQSGGAVVNGWLAIGNSFSAETMAHQGWDSLTIDLQHGVVDYTAMVPMLQAISTTPMIIGFPSPRRFPCTNAPIPIAPNKIAPKRLPGDGSSGMIQRVS